MSVFSNIITPQGLEPLQFPTKFRSHLAQNHTTVVVDKPIYVPWQQVHIQGPCTVAVTNRGPEVVRVNEPSSHR